MSWLLWWLLPELAAARAVLLSAILHGLDVAHFSSQPPGSIIMSSFISTMWWIWSCLRRWSRNIWNAVGLINCSITVYINSLAYVLRQLNTIINMFWLSSFQRLSKVNTICPLSLRTSVQDKHNNSFPLKKDKSLAYFIFLCTFPSETHFFIVFFVSMGILNSSILDRNPYMSLKNWMTFH